MEDIKHISNGKMIERFKGNTVVSVIFIFARLHMTGLRIQAQRQPFRRRRQ